MFTSRRLLMLGRYGKRLHGDTEGLLTDRGFVGTNELKRPHKFCR